MTEWDVMIILKLGFFETLPWFINAVGVRLGEFEFSVGCIVL